MADEFVGLAAQLRAAAMPQPSPPAVPAGDLPSLPSREREANERECVVAELALIRLAALEAFDRARHHLLELLARDVLARELSLAPVDIDALAAQALRAFAECEPVALVVAPADAARVSAPLPVRVDGALAPGDLVIEVRDGQIDARFAVRLAEATQASFDA